MACIANYLQDEFEILCEETKVFLISFKMGQMQEITLTMHHTFICLLFSFLKALIKLFWNISMLCFVWLQVGNILDIVEELVEEQTLDPLYPHKYASATSLYIYYSFTNNSNVL